MGKKVAFICTGLLLGSLLLSCSGKNISQDSGKNVPQTTQAAVDAKKQEAQSTQTASDSNTKNSNDKQNSKTNPLDQLAEGKINGAAFGISANCMDMLKSLGKPDDQGTDGGSYYYIYGKITYFSDSIDENKGNISAIAVRDTADICGVKVGMKPAEIKKVLGQPASEGEDEGNGWSMTYEVKKGLYISFFAEGKDSPVISVLLAQKSEL